MKYKRNKNVILLLTVGCMALLYMKNSMSLLHTLLHKFPNPFHHHGIESDYSHIREMAFHAPFHHEHETSPSNAHDHFAEREDHEIHDHDAIGQSIAQKNLESDDHHHEHLQMDESDHPHEHSFLDHFGLSENQEHEQEDDGKEQLQKLDWIAQPLPFIAIKPYFINTQQKVFSAIPAVISRYQAIVSPPPELQ